MLDKLREAFPHIDWRHSYKGRHIAEIKNHYVFGPVGNGLGIHVVEHTRGWEYRACVGIGGISGNVANDPVSAVRTLLSVITRYSEMCEAFGPLLQQEKDS